MLRFQIITALVTGLAAIISASNTCYYYYGVQRTSTTCEAQGGVDEDIQNKMLAVQGGLEGIKAISSINKNLLTTMQSNMRKIQQQYSQYASTLSNIKKEIEDLKKVLNPVPGHVIGKRAAKDPNQSARLALSTAEWKLINITTMLQDTLRSRSIMESTLEQRLQKQQNELQDLMNKIQKIENAIAHPRGKRSVPSVSSLQSEVLKMTQKVMDLLVDVNAKRQVSRIRTADLMQQLDSIKVPRDELKQKVSNLTSSVNDIPRRLNKADSDLKSLQTDIVTVDAKLKPKLNQAVTEYSKMMNQYKKSQTDSDDLQLKIHEENSAVQNDTQVLNDVKTTFKGVLNDINYLKGNSTSQKIDLRSLRNSPIIALGSVQYYAEQEIQKQKKDLKQLHMMYNALNHNVQSLPKPAGK